MKSISTVKYKGSKRKLLSEIQQLSSGIGETFFDGFSGTGIVSAHMRNEGFIVTANDISPSANLYSSVFLSGYNSEEVERHIEKINNLDGIEGWLTQNYSGERVRKVRGTGSSESRPLGFIKENAMKLDAAREYAESIKTKNEKNAVVFSIILALSGSFNNGADQKSCLKEWQASSKKPIVFKEPTRVSGHLGYVSSEDILNTQIEADVVYFDPPYTRGVLYNTCYHINDSVAVWDKPLLNYAYAIPRPHSVCLRENGESAGGFYSSTTAPDAFNRLLTNTKSKRTIISYSDAPRNSISLEELVELSKGHGYVEVYTKEHKMYSQPKMMSKSADSLTEFFITIDT